MTFFQRNRQVRSQHMYPRRGGGFTAPQITLHTYEAPHTRSLLAAATWLLQRRDPGSYHALAGAKSATDVMQLAPWSHETWHSVPSNNWAIGVSAVAYAHQWNTIPRAARDNLVKSMAYASANAAKWLEKHHGRKVEPRILTRAQAMRKESGFVMHSTMDPGRRTDAGRDFPWSVFFAEFNRLMGATTPAPSKPSKPSPKPKVWPYTGLSNKAGRGTLNRAWTRIMADIGYDKGTVIERQQQWLAAHGYYKGAMDGVAGQWFVDALQGFLADRNYYKGARDAFRVPVSQSWGSWLKQAEIDYLNDQRRTYPQ